MMYPIYLLAFLLYVPHLTQATTIQDVTMKIILTQQYLNTEVNKHRTEIPKNIANARNSLRSRAEAIKAEIRAGPANCNNWLSQIDSILQYQINFQYAFQTCEKTSEINNLDNVKYSLQKLQKSANDLISLCAIIGNCQSNINLLYNSVLLIEADIAKKSADIAASSASCIESKRGGINKSLDSNYDYWKKCTNY